MFQNKNDQDKKNELKLLHSISQSNQNYNRDIEKLQQFKEMFKQ